MIHIHPPLRYRASGPLQISINLQMCSQARYQVSNVKIKFSMVICLHPTLKICHVLLDVSAIN